MNIKKSINNLFDKLEEKDISEDINTIMLDVKKGQQILLKDGTYGFFEEFCDGDSDFKININNVIISKNINEIKYFINKLKDINCPICKSDKFEKGGIETWHGYTCFKPKISRIDHSCLCGSKEIIAYRCINCGNYIFLDK